MLEYAKKEKDAKEKLRKIKKLLKANTKLDKGQEKLIPEIGTQDVESNSILPSRFLELYETITIEKMESKLKNDECNESQCSSSSSESEITDKEEAIIETSKTISSHNQSYNHTIECAANHTKVAALKQHKANALRKPTSFKPSEKVFSQRINYNSTKPSKKQGKGIQVI
jgi:hypothetical protein